MLNKNVVFVIGAHPDDDVFGAGGTIAKYSSQGKKIVSLTMSYGEGSHLWLKRKVIVKTRVNEAKEAHKILGVHSDYFFGLREGFFLKDAEERNIYDRLESLIKEFRPYMIITHSVDDWFHDHIATARIVNNVVKNLSWRKKPDVYCFDIWSPLTLKKRTNPKLFVDITDFFNLKIKALKCFRSQGLAMFSLYWSVFVRAFLSGSQIRKRFAEVFYKVDV